MAADTDWISLFLTLKAAIGYLRGADLALPLVDIG